MPILESETLKLDALKDNAKRLKCSCGGNLTVAWGGYYGYNCYILRCASNIEHNDFMRPAIISNYNLPGYNMPGILKRREHEMMQKYGEEKTKQIVRIGGGNPIATLTQKGAVAMLTVLYPEAAKCASGQAAIIKGALICRDYGLNPAMDHIFLIGYWNKKTGKMDYSVVRGIKASRLICGREKSYGYIDDTPRVMTSEEQIRIYGETDSANLTAICKLKDKDGNTFTGYGKWPKSEEPQGTYKGNSKFNMACIRAERQALDKLNPGAMPADVDVVDERYVDVNKVTVTEDLPEIAQIEASEPEQVEAAHDAASESDDRLGSTETVNAANHFCDKHATPFFMRGSMKAFAHPITDKDGIETGKWCTEPAAKLV